MMRKEDDRFRTVQEDEPLFITGRRTGRVIAYRVFSASVFFCICWIWLYRVTAPVEIDDNRTGFARFAWSVMLLTEIWFGLYWIVLQSPRLNPVWQFTFTDRLSRRYGNDLPRLDVFVCTADPVIEPPLMVVNTVLSVAALDYPPEKLAVYLSDDGGSELTFYALAEAAEFAKVWVPYCKRFEIEPRSPAAYLSRKASGLDSAETEEVARLYKEMAVRIETAARLGRIPDEARLKYGDGFSQWDSDATRRSHGTILQILVDGRKENTVTVPTLVYLSREKRPEHHHHFKAGAMNALIRVSSKITCGRIILNLDCDMYSNNSKSARDALCILLDEKEGKEIAFVQFPQCFENLTKNDLYASMMRVGYDVEFNGLDGNGGPLYIGTGCFHRRDVICGRKYGEAEEEEEEEESEDDVSQPEMIKALASCTYEENSQWGKEMGVKYGCPVEDVITGLEIQCRGWKSVYLNPKNKAFVGVAPTNLHQMLVQHRRWSEGHFQVLLSEYSPVWYGQGKIGLGLILGYCCYGLWAPSSVPVLLYSLLTSLSLLKGIPLFPKVWSWWFIPFGYVTVAANGYSLAEFLWCGGTLRGWWNEQRVWLYRRTSSFLFGVLDTIKKKLGVSESGFVITAKVAEEEAAERYEKEVMEFGVESPMFLLLGTLGMLNLFCFVAPVVMTCREAGGDIQRMGLQFVITGLLVVLNWPLYEGMLLRRDKGKMPMTVTVKSFVLALSACTCVAFL